MFIMIIDTEDSNTLAIHSALGGVFGPVDVDSLRRLALSPADGQTARSITGDAVSDLMQREGTIQQAARYPQQEAEQAAWDRAHPLGQTIAGIAPSPGIDPTDHLISPPPPLGQTMTGEILIPLDMGNGQYVYIPQTTIPAPTEQLYAAPPSAPSEPQAPPYLIAQPFVTDPTDNLIPQNGFDPFQQFAPRVPVLYQNMPQEPSSDELQVWAAQQRADAAARFQQQQFAEMQARGIQGQVPPADFTGFPQTPQVQYQPPVPNI